MTHAQLETRIPGLVLIEHEFSLPLDHAEPEGDRITVFAREVAHPERRDRPYLVFLQGGPGQEAPRPTFGPTGPGWLTRALKDFRVLMLDQRGTGRSAPVSPSLTGDPADQADYLSRFRADAIVADAEAIRRELGVDRWSVLGQSFGGFCALRYLSAAPEGLREAFLTGGLPPVATPVDDVYRATYDVMRARSTTFYARYPQDRDRVRAIHELLLDGRVSLPNGDPLTVRHFRQTGIVLGMSGGAERLHYLLERDPRSSAFAHDIAAMLPFSARNPLYAVIHEACYADGQATRWSADRVLPDDFRDDLTLFTGEHVTQWLFDDDSRLRPLKAAADLLAEQGWPALYDADSLASCEVPCSAAIYVNDAYVPRAFSEQTAGLIPTMRPWITNEYEHNGLGVAGDRILDRLIGLARGTAL